MGSQEAKEVRSGEAREVGRLGGEGGARRRRERLTLAPSQGKGRVAKTYSTRVSVWRGREKRLR